MREVTKDRAMELLRDYVRGCGTQRKVALLMDISETYLSDVLNGKRDPSLVLARLGINRVIRYQVPKTIRPPSH